MKWQENTPFPENPFLFIESKLRSMGVQTTAVSFVGSQKLSERSRSQMFKIFRRVFFHANGKIFWDSRKGFLLLWNMSCTLHILQVFERKRTVSQIRWEPKAVGDVATAVRLVQGWLGWRLPHGSDQPGRKKHAVVIISSSVMMIQITMRNFTGGPGSRWLDVAGSDQPSLPRFPRTPCSTPYLLNVVAPIYFHCADSVTTIRILKIVQNLARSSASTWSPWTSNEAVSMEFPPTTGQTRTW